MAYTCEGMNVLTTAQVGARFANDGLVGCYKLYPDNTESAIEVPITLEEVMNDLDKGIKFGEEE